MANFKTFYDFFIITRGFNVVHKKRIICKAEAYWGIKRGTLNWRDLTLQPKPGWVEGDLVSPSKYSVWLYQQNF